MHLADAHHLHKLVGLGSIGRMVWLEFDEAWDA